MERKLYNGITTPSAVLATLFGLVLLFNHLEWYLQQPWLQVKLVLVAVLWIYHIFCGYYLYQFKHNQNQHSHVFYRWFNEIPVIILVAVMILVIVK